MVIRVMDAVMGMWKDVRVACFVPTLVQWYTYEIQNSGFSKDTIKYQSILDMNAIKELERIKRAIRADLQIIINNVISFN